MNGLEFGTMVSQLRYGVNGVCVCECEWDVFARATHHSTALRRACEIIEFIVFVVAVCIEMMEIRVAADGRIEVRR